MEINQVSGGGNGDVHLRFLLLPANTPRNIYVRVYAEHEEQSTHSQNRVDDTLTIRRNDGHDELYYEPQWLYSGQGLAVSDSDTFESTFYADNGSMPPLYYDVRVDGDLDWPLTGGNLFVRLEVWTDAVALPTPTPTSAPSGCVPDTFEPDDSLSTGNPITLEEEQRHSLCPQGDEDWVNFQANVTFPGQRNLLVETFDLEPDDINPNGNTQLTVTDESAIQIGTNQDRGFAPPSASGQPVVKSSRLVWHPATSGVFNINIFPETPVNELTSSGYSLRLVNSFTVVDPVDQASWGPARVNVPLVWRNGNIIYFTQYFTYDQAELDALINLNTTLAWEFRRPAVNPLTGVEEKNSNVDFGDYWQSVNGNCGGVYYTNLPNHSDKFTEESNLISGCGSNPFWSEEFELFVDDPTQLVAGKVYYVMLKFYIHDEYVNSNYQFYISKAEHCMVEAYGTFCNVVPGAKSGANLIEGYLQPAP